MRGAYQPVRCVPRRWTRRRALAGCRKRDVARERPMQNLPTHAGCARPDGASTEAPIGAVLQQRPRPVATGASPYVAQGFSPACRAGLKSCPTYGSASRRGHLRFARNELRAGLERSADDGELTGTSARARPLGCGRVPGRGSWAPASRRRPRRGPRQRAPRNVRRLLLEALRSAAGSLSRSATDAGLQAVMNAHSEARARSIIFTSQRGFHRTLMVFGSGSRTMNEVFSYSFHSASSRVARS